MQSKIRLLFLIFVLCPILNTYSQNDNKYLTAKRKLHVAAYRYLNGINTDVDYEKAKKIYMALASKNDAEAFSKLGTMYKNGLGVSQNADSALSFYTQAANLNHPKALFNLGLMYKNGDGITQDFKQSLHYFERALIGGNDAAYYAVGYHYYKGLGVEQNYEKANRYFKAGAEKGIPSCMYFYGYAKIRGYGIEQDTVVGKEWILKSAKEGYTRGIDFISKYKSVNSLITPSVISESAKFESHKPNKITKSLKNKKDKLGNADISGLWEGKLIAYDWSGEKIVKERKLELTLDATETSMKGFWIQDDSINIQIDGYKNDSAWFFDNTKYQKKRQHSWEIQNGSFELIQDGGKDYLKGTITRKSLNLKEPDRPIYIVLERNNSGIKRSAESIVDIKDESTISSSLNVAPNPFIQNINIRLTLSDTQFGRFVIVDSNGKIVYQTPKAFYKTGVNEKDLNLDLAYGGYILQFISDDIQLSSRIIKK